MLASPFLSAFHFGIFIIIIHSRRACQLILFYSLPLCLMGHRKIMGLRLAIQVKVALFLNFLLINHKLTLFNTLL